MCFVHRCDCFHSYVWRNRSVSLISNSSVDNIQNMSRGRISSSGCCCWYSGARVVQVCMWRQGPGDVRASVCVLLFPQALRPEVISQLGTRQFPIPFPHLYAFCLNPPVWWIFYPILLSWVIWGIIQKVSAGCLFQLVITRELWISLMQN